MNKPVVVFSLTTPISIQLLGNRLHLLVEAGVDLHVLVGEAPEGDIPELPKQAGLHVIPLKRGIDPLNDAVALTRTTRLIKSLRPRLVAAATPKASLITLLAARLNRVPVRVWEVWGAKWDGPPAKLDPILMALDRLIAKSATTVVAVSPSLARLLATRKVVKEEVRVIGQGSSMGVDTALFCERPHPNDGQVPTIGFVGRLSRDKGVDTVITVASQVREVFPNLRLLLVGEVDGSDPPSKATLEFIQHHSWIVKTGWLSETHTTFQDMDVLLFPSEREGMPNALLEAAASGVPSVCYDVTGCKDIVDHGETGYTARVQDKTELASSVLRLMKSPRLARLLGQAARRKVKREFEASTVQMLWRDFYLDKLVGPKS